MTLEFQQKLKRILDLIQKLDLERGVAYRCALCPNNSVNIYRSRNVSCIKDIKMVAANEKGMYVGFNGNGDGPQGFELGFGMDIVSEIGKAIPGLFFEGTEQDYHDGAEFIIAYLRDGKIPELALN